MYVGPIAGWFVEAHGWSTFYLFSVVAAVPGIALLLLCRQTLEHTQRTASFIPRSEYPQAYALALVSLSLSIPRKSGFASDYVTLRNICDKASRSR
ncbi:hypothetical protein KAM622c_39550 [Klebsiella quasipneumoniae subsp. quasipneumoniae]|nr:hypothetical protein KAM622c_39550 [Klebsiella quasipneumoniae subsp. quasipneumoniae]